MDLKKERDAESVRNALNRDSEWVRSKEKMIMFNTTEMTTKMIFRRSQRIIMTIARTKIWTKGYFMCDAWAFYVQFSASWSTSVESTENLLLSYQPGVIITKLGLSFTEINGHSVWESIFFCIHANEFIYRNLPSFLPFHNLSYLFFLTLFTLECCIFYYINFNKYLGCDGYQGILKYDGNDTKIS